MWRITHAITNMYRKLLDVITFRTMYGKVYIDNECVQPDIYGCHVDLDIDVD